MALNFDRPLTIKETDFFVNAIEEYFNDYIPFVKKKLKTYIRKEDRFDYLEQLESNVEGIKTCLIDYRNGHRLECAESFKKLMSKNSRYLKNLLNRDDSLKKSNNVFFRIRRDKISDKEIKDNHNHTLFHLPFEKRKFVGNGRFNSAGIPILYLSDCLKIPYLECDKPKTEFCDLDEEDSTINVGMFRNSKSFRFFDFSIYHWGFLIEKHLANPNIDTDLTDYIIIFPIIAAIHVKINFAKEPSFHFDYVFSSLIMDWLKNLELANNTSDMGLLFPIYTLKYSSVKLFDTMSSIDTLSTDEECFNRHNYAFSTKYYSNSSHCLTLESVFLKSGSNRPLYGNDVFFEKFKNRNISDVELVEIENLLISGELPTKK